MPPTLEQYCRENHKDLVKYARYRLGSPDYAEDCVQEMYLRAMKYWHTFDNDKGSLRQWLATILNNCLRYMKHDLRMQGRTVEIEEWHLQDDKNYFEDEQVAKKLEKLLEKVDNQAYKTICWLHFFKQLKHKEVMEVTDFSKRRVTRAIASFKELVKEEYE